MLGRSWCSGAAAPPVVAPAQAAAFGLNTRTFFDDFDSLSTIDVNNTGNAGFKWYTKNNWPNAPGAAGAQWRSYPPTPANAISIANSVVTLATDQVGGFSQVLNSACSNGAGFTGTAFTGPLYVEFVASFDPTKAAGQGSWPALWFGTIEFMTGTVGLGGRFIELDVFEALPGAGTVNPAVTVHEWTTQSGSFTNTLNNNNGASLGSPDFTQMHKYGFLYVPAASNGGTGLFRWYFDDLHLTPNDVSFSPTGPASPGASPTNANGTFAIADAQHLTLILGCGLNWPIKIDAVSVWQ